jgi:putative ABC transport system ATP-binding protein
MSEVILQLDKITKVYGAGELKVTALDAVELSVSAGEFVAVMGPSGSGKSTCMNIIGCLDVPTHGAYRFCGVDTAELSVDALAMLRRRYLGFIFQSFNLIARTSAVENVELPLVYMGVGRKERRERAMNALRSVGLGDRAGHGPSELSGGQQQRVAIARALVTSPTLLLADEPTGNLDTATTEDVIELLKGLNESGLTIVMVTHEPEVALHAKRVVVFVDGRIAADGTPKEVLS